MVSKRIAALNVFDNKRAVEKWHRSIDEHRGWVPINHHSDVNRSSWESIRRITDNFLRKKKPSENERDAVIAELIDSHTDRILALSACSHKLSPSSLLAILDTFEDKNDHDFEYLQGFVAVAHGNTHAFAAGDETWATTLAAISQDLTSAVPAIPTVNLVLGKWRDSPPPNHPRLRAKARRDLIVVCQKLNAALQSHQEQKNWIAAIPLAACLSRIYRENERTSALQDILSWEIPSWRSWASWMPDVERLRKWKTPPLPSLAPFWDLLGPDWHMSNAIRPTMLTHVLCGGQLTAWMMKSRVISSRESSSPGDTADARKESTAFFERLFAIIDSIWQDEGGVAILLEKIVRDPERGLNNESLSLLEVAVKIVSIQAPAFIPTMLGSKAGEDPASLIALGIRALSHPQAVPLRNYLFPSIERFVAHAADTVRRNFLDDLGLARTWLPNAQSLVFLRNTLASCSWWKHVQIQGLDITGSAINTTRSIENLHHLHVALSKRHGFAAAASACIANIVTGVSEQQADGMVIVGALHKVWDSEGPLPIRLVAMDIACLVEIASADRALCISSIIDLPQIQASKLRTCLPDSTQAISPTRACQRMVRIAAQTSRMHASSTEPWRSLVEAVMAYHWVWLSSALLQRDFTETGFMKYRKWVQNLKHLFGETLPSVMQSHGWMVRLMQYAKAVDAVQAQPSSRLAMHCILTSSSGPESDQILAMLRSIDSEQTCADRVELMLHVALHLRRITGPPKKKYPSPVASTETISQTVTLLSSLPNRGFQLCEKLASLATEESPSVAALHHRLWQQDVADAETLRTLRHLSSVLGLPETPSPEAVKDYFARRVTAMMKQAASLEEMRLRVQRVDHSGVSAVLSDLNIEGANASALESEMTSLPNEVFNNVEQVDDRTVEMHFPLTHLNHVQRLAAGVDVGESLVVRITVSDDGRKESFCVHVVDIKTDWHSGSHLPCNIASPSTAPNRLLCNGRGTMLGYALTRRMWAWLKGSSSLSLNDLHINIVGTINSFGNYCHVCNRAHSPKANLHRPVCCVRPACRATWLLTALEFRLADLRLDEQVVELLLGAVHAACTTMSAKAISVELLPDRPERLNSNQKLELLLDTIPELKTVGPVDSIRTSYSVRAELLLSWVCNSYRGFLVSATNNNTLRIPNMPDVQQFILADNSPEITAAFSQHEHLQPRQVLFHGTSMDRLYAIIAQGLKILSQTALQTHGAAHGNGIYLATEPTTAISYAKAANRRVSTFSHRHHHVVNKRVLLGIEYAGDEGNMQNGMYVATDPTKLLLRYIFLLPAGFKAPLANHLVPAMQSSFYALKAGAKVRT